ncbi:MAG: hypothetical protein Q9181_002841 [Wetmoreana brouardii]
MAELKFYAPPVDGSKPFNYPDGTPIPKACPKGTLVMPISRSPSMISEIDFTSDDSIKANYYPEVERLLLENIPGAKRVHLFDNTVRLLGGNRPPVLRVHIDQTPAAAIGRVRTVLPDEADELLKSRLRIINVWRPLNGPVQCSPLAFADSSTVRDEALVAVEHRYTHRTGETISVQHMDEKWYYWSGIGNDERILLQCFDSEKGGRVPHTAFVDPRSPAGGKQRESIEVRALVFG